MTIDFRKPARILVVHGVQVSEDEKIESDRQIKALVTRSLVDNHIVDREFDVRGYFYEDINDNAQSFYRLIAAAMTAGKPLQGVLLKSVVDLVGDVVTSARNTSTAHKIRKGLKAAIRDSYAKGQQLLLVAHSLGTIYALDVINELVADARYFKGDNKATWPVQGFISMGSPLGLGLSFAGVNVFDKRTIQGIRNAKYRLFPWHNYFNRLDPIVSGSLFGAPVDVDISRGPVEKRYGPDVIASNWRLRGHVVTSGEQWLMAHVQYWTNPSIGDRILDMLWG